MTSPRPAQRILENDFLSMRCLILDLAAALDRVDRGKDRASIETHQQLELLRGGLAILQADGPGRAEKVQMLFSDSYRPGWNEG